MHTRTPTSPVGGTNPGSGATTPIADLMTRQVVTIEPEATLRELASVLTTEHVGGLPVVRGEEVVGVVSASDLLAFDADAPGTPIERSRPDVGDGTGPEILELDVEENEEAAAAYFAEFWQDAGPDLVHRFAHTDAPEWSVLDEHTVAELMSRRLLALPPEMDVREAARRMLVADVHRVLVMQDGRLVGVMTSLDVLRAVAERRLDP